jgi:serine phosphatase RsbU (regulator of sigma subunit)
MLLGVLEDGQWDDIAVEVSAGYRLLMLTDGVSETFSPDDQLFGRTRIQNQLEAQQHVPVSQTLTSLTQSLESHRLSELQHDDITMLMIELNR